MANAEPIRFGQVVQIIDARPGQAQNPTFSTLVVAGGYTNPLLGDDDTTKKQQDDRVITTTKSDILKDETCDCVQPPVGGGGFPAWALLSLAAIPITLILIHDHDKTPTPGITPTPNLTPTPPTTPTPGVTPTPGITPTPGVTPTPTPPGMTPTPSPPGVTPSPTPPGAVPEPMTILLFGTGLASIGLAARRRYGKKREDADNSEDED
jgi:hypothetical protein